MTKPIMTPDEARFMAFEGWVQWTHAVVVQTARISEARKRFAQPDPTAQRMAICDSRTECDYLAIAANKLLEFKVWTLSFGLCCAVDFSEIDSFSRMDIRALRNKREHVLEYFKGESTSGWWAKRRSTTGTPAALTEPSLAEGLTM